jgi:TatD DNase family protein
MLFDSHCHLTDDAFRGDRPEVLRRARDAGVEHIVTVASTPEDAEVGLSLVESHDWIRTTAGYHPHEAGAAREGWTERLRRLLGRPGVVAVGECGLDYHYDNAPRDAQRRVFEDQVGLAAETGLPLVVHSRDADEDMAAILRALPDGVSGVLHCFTGGDALFETALAVGFHVSFTGIASFRSWKAAHQVRAVPEGRIMIETDAPYLAPVPHRGRRNEPAFVADVARAVAAQRDETVEHLAAHTTGTALRFYGLK